MTKKRKRYPDLNQKLERPWCYYCERDFDDLKILISHQKAKHFKCDRCGRRLNTAGGLSVHMNQVHKENLSHVENAIPGRSGLDIEIFGMEGVPQEVVEQHNQQVTHKHFEEEQERARVTGNPVRGLYSNGTAPPNKRAKVKESVEDITARAAKFRQDKANGLIPAGGPVEPPSQPTPPQAQPPYGAPPPQTAPFAPSNQQFPPPGAPQYPPGQQPFPPPGFPGQPPAGFPGAPPSFAQGGSPVSGGGPGGLPQRPPFGAPPAGAFPPGQNGNTAISESVDDLIASATGVAASTPTEGTAPEKEKKSKKDKNIKLVYFDETISPEEKMAALNRYASSART